MDPNLDGAVTVYDFRTFFEALLKKINNRMNEDSALIEEQAASAVCPMDLDGDGMVNFREFADYICAHKYEEFVRKHSRSLSVTGLVHEGIHTTTTKGGGRKRMLELMETRKYSRKLLDKIDTRTKALVVDRLFSLCERRQPPSEQQDEAGGAGPAAAQGTSPLAHVHG